MALSKSETVDTDSRVGTSWSAEMNELRIRPNKREIWPPKSTQRILCSDKIGERHSPRMAPVSLKTYCAAASPFCALSAISFAVNVLASMPVRTAYPFMMPRLDA